jgi:translocator protein
LRWAKSRCSPTRQPLSAREGDEDLASIQEFGQAPSLEVSRRPPGRLKAVAIAVICVCVSSVSSYVFTNPEMPRIDPVIEFPWFFPIGPYFAVIWIALAISLICSFYLLLRSSPDNRLRRFAMTAYTLMMVLHTVWAWLLFAKRLPMLSFCAAMPLVASIVVAVWLTAQIDKRAGLLLAPYLAWAFFAATSTFHIAMSVGW